MDRAVPLVYRDAIYHTFWGYRSSRGVTRTAAGVYEVDLDGDYLVSWTLSAEGTGTALVSTVVNSIYQASEKVPSTPSPSSHSAQYILAASAGDTIRLIRSGTSSISMLSGTLAITRIGPLSDTPTPSVAYVRTNTTDGPWGAGGEASIAQEMNTVFGADGWDSLRFETVVASHLFSLENYSFVYLEGSDTGADALEAFLQAHRATLEAYVSAGGRVFVNAAVTTGDGMNFAFGVSLIPGSFSSMTTPLTAYTHPIHLTQTHPNLAHLTIPTITGVLSGTSTPLLFAGLSDQPGNPVVLGERAEGAGRILFGAIVPTNQFITPSSGGLRPSVLRYASGQL